MNIVHGSDDPDRTALVVCAYLLLAGQFSDPQDAIDFFNQKRALIPSLHMPSMRRYVPSSTYDAPRFFISNHHTRSRDIIEERVALHSLLVLS